MVTLQRKVTQVVGTSSGALQRRSFGFASREDELKSLALRLAHLQEVVIGLDFLIKAVRGDESIQAGRDMRFHYNNINEAENARVRIEGFFQMIRKRDDYIEQMNQMLEDIDEQVTGSIFTPREELIRTISGLIVKVRRELMTYYDMTQREFDELIGEKADPGRVDVEDEL